MNKITRRKFLAKSSAFGLFASTIQFLPSSILAKNSVSPSQRINVGFVGTGLIAKGHLAFAASSPRTQIMATCDVNSKNLKTGAGIINNAAKKNSAVPFREVDTYEHYEELIARKDIDAVWVCTPDHWHVQIAVAAIKAGKAVYLEKPISLTIEEGRILANAVKKYDGVLQGGSQQRSSEQFRLAAELVRNGYLGNMKRIDVSLGVFPAEPKNLEEQPIPDGFNYDKWLGHTPWRPYNAERVKGNYKGGWRCFLEYGARKEGDWGAHHYDIVQWGLGRDKSGPSEFYPENYKGEKYRHFKYDTGETVYVNDPKLDKEKTTTVLFQGDEAEIMVNRNRITCTKPSLLKLPLKASDERLQISADHRADFLDAIAYGHKNIVNAETAHRTATVCQLMSIARRTKESLKWDPKTETITEGSKEVKSMTSRPRRAPYLIEA
ncbi:MAG: Gfo/Idh/MocA family oxidoreductase [Opitutales bacterium]